ncbi:carboxypeptidase-like regulatory domain-containing protein [Prolixibacteraceae bacterium JC049]|nr:carboxypeptidase-like regulatory domain-containing protein [Prolixibacteraceae bacterium JC049]
MSNYSYPLKPLFLLVFLLIAFFSQAQTQSVRDILEKVAKEKQLELCYSDDLVALDDSIDWPDNNWETDTIFFKLKETTGYQFQISSGNLMIVPREIRKIRLSGMIKDAKSGELLPYTNIVVGNTGMGSISNAIGYFDFKMSDDWTGKELTFSCMGYHAQKFTIPNDDEEGIIIKLEPKPYNINEIVVLPNGNEARDIVARAAKRIKRNGNRRRFQMDAFYRRVSYRDSTVKELLEAALTIKDPGINTSAANIKVNLDQYRKSTNYLIPSEERWAKAFKRMEKYFGGHRNLFYRMLYKDGVRTIKASWWYEPLEEFEDFKYQVESIEWLDTMKVYKIRYTYDRLYPSGKRASELGDDDEGGYIFVNANDYGIMRIDHWWKLGSGKNKSYNLKGVYFSKSSCVYQKYNGKYYLKYITNLGFPDGKSWIKDDNPDKKKRKIIGRQYNEEMLVINNIATERKKMKRIRYREWLDRTENSLETKYEYDSAFWANYNVVKLKPLPERAMNELQWEKALEDQFKENSTTHVED